MKSEELMLGDYVNFLIDIEGGDTDYNQKVAQYQPMKIVSLSFWVNNDGEVESAEGVINDIDQVKPISLTLEILEKNGFWYQHNVGFVMEEYEYEVIYDQLDHKLRILKNREQILNLEYFNEMCVHELQHILRLCGIDKEIII